MKQTAVEWIIEQINNVKPHQFCSLETIKEWCDQAKEMEKQQVIDAYDVQWEYEVKNGEDYYNKKFKKK